MSNQEHSSRNVCLAIGISFVLLFLLGSFSPIHAAADATYYAGDYHVSNGTYLFGGVSSSLRTVDSDYFVVGSAPQATLNALHGPMNYTLLGGTTCVSGATGDLASSNDVGMVYRSHPSATSAQALYAHQEATTIAGNTYNTQRPENADLTGTNFSAPMTIIGRQVWARFVYSLSGISSIPASTWTTFYRTWKDLDQTPGVAYDAVGSGNNGGGSTSVSWSHKVGSGSNRIMIVGVSIRDTTISVSGITYGAQSLTFIRADSSATFVRSELWYLIAPASGTATITVALSGTSRASGGSCTYTGVAQASPIDGNAGGFGKSSSPSQSVVVNTANSWLLGHIAVTGSSRNVSSEGTGQIMRWDQLTTGGTATDQNRGHGSDKASASTGSQTMSWTLSGSEDYAVSVAAFRPASPAVGHADVDILIRQSNGTIRTTIAFNVANSGELTSTPSTLSGTYSWATYTVTNQTDYLEIAYYIETTSGTSSPEAHLRIDDNALPMADQTRVANLMLPSEYTAEVEFTALSNAFIWTQISWTVETSWTTDSVATTLQLFDFNMGSYPTNGNGFISYVTNVTPHTDEMRTQVIATNPQHFRDSASYWRIKIKGVKTSTRPFDFNGDWIELRSTYYSGYTVSTEFLFLSIANDAITQLNFTVVSEHSILDVSVTIQVWNYSSSAYVNRGQGYLRYISSGANETQLLSIDTDQKFYTSNGSARLLITSLSSTPTPYQQRVNQIRLDSKNAATTLWLFTWPAAFLIALPAPLALLILWFVKFKRKKNVIPGFHKRMTAFSEQFKMSHQQLVGKKMLLEVDPASDYNVALSGFVSEAKNNGESLFIVTNKNSALHSVFSPAGDANFLLMTSQIHYQQQINKKETILPESDVSVLLNAIVKVQQTHADKTINLLFDNVSDIIVRCGFEKTYKFTRLLLQALSSVKTTALFIFIPTAHDQEITSSIRGLFQTHLTYTKDGPMT